MIALYCINCGKELEKCQKKYCSFKCLGIVLYKESIVNLQGVGQMVDSSVRNGDIVEVQSLSP